MLGRLAEADGSGSFCCALGSGVTDGLGVLFLGDSGFGDFFFFFGAESFLAGLDCEGGVVLPINGAGFRACSDFEGGA